MTRQPNSVNPDTIVHVEVGFPIGCATISCLLAIIVITFYWSTKNNLKRENIVFLATAITTAIAGTSAFHAFQNIKLNNQNQQKIQQLNTESHKLDRTLSYIARWNDPQFSISKKIISRMLDSVKQLPKSERAEAIKKMLETDSAKKQAATNILNFLEEMSLCIKQEILEEKLLLEFYRTIVVSCSETFSSFITARRNQTGSNKLYEGFLNLANKWNDLNGS